MLGEKLGMLNRPTIIRESAVEAARRVDLAANQALNEVAAASDDIAALSDAELKNIRRARVLNAVMQTIYEQGRSHLDPADISYIEIMNKALDTIASNRTQPLATTLQNRKATPKQAIEAESAISEHALNSISE